MSRSSIVTSAKDHTRLFPTRVFEAKSTNIRLREVLKQLFLARMLSGRALKAGYGVQQSYYTLCHYDKANP